MARTESSAKKTGAKVMFALAVTEETAKGNKKIHFVKYLKKPKTLVSKADAYKGAIFKQFAKKETAEKHADELRQIEGLENLEVLQIKGKLVRDRKEASEDQVQKSQKDFAEVKDSKEVQVNPGGATTDEVVREVTV